MEELRGDVLTKAEMEFRGIQMLPSSRGGVEFRAMDSLNTIAMRLIDLGYIEEYHHTDASVFMDLRRAYQSSIGIKWGIREPIISEEILPAHEAIERYDAIRREIGLKRATLVMQLVEKAMLEIPQALHAAEANIYRQCFEELSDAMMHVKKLADRC